MLVAEHNCGVACSAGKSAHGGKRASGQSEKPKGEKIVGFAAGVVPDGAEVCAGGCAFLGLFICSSQEMHLWGIEFCRSRAILWATLGASGWPR